MNHLRNHRLSVLGDGTSPTGHVRASIGIDGDEVEVAPHDQRAGNNAITAGGGTRVFGAQAWRFLPDDFRMASCTACRRARRSPIGRSRTRTSNRSTTGSSGSSASPARRPIGTWSTRLPHAAVPRCRRKVRSSPPRPPVSAGRPARSRSSSTRGPSTTVPPACAAASASDSRVPSTPRTAPTTPFCPGRSRPGLTSVSTRSPGSATPARSTCRRGVTRTVRAGRVALAGGAVETARLLQVSGLGNDWVGDCLQGHTYAGAGRFDDVVIDGFGPARPSAACSSCTATTVSSAAGCSPTSS